MKTLFTILFIIIATSVFTQNNYQDVVYLKNGSIIHGIIIEQVPLKSIKIKTADNNVFVFQMDEIEKISKEEIPSTNNNNSVKRKGFIGLEIGANIPIGKFADIYDGAAKTGLQINLINFGYLFSDYIGITATWFGATNPIKGQSSDYLWSHGGLMAGPLFSFPVSDKIDWEIKPVGGIAWATITNTKLDYVSSLAFDIGTGFRYNISKLIALSLFFDYSKAKFNWNIGTQTMGTIAIKGGFAFRLK